jgi:hypothetical protein
MPQLITGHMRYTDDDYLMQEYNDMVKTEYGNKSLKKLNKLLQAETLYLGYMRDAEITKIFDTSANIKKSLKKALTIVTAIAYKEGYSFNELILA